MDPDSARQLPKAGNTPVAGSLVAGKYRILRTLGEGGMGIVVEARHIHLDQRVAIKFLRGVQAEDSRNVARFRREARAGAKVKSDHVAQVYDVGILEDGTRYLVMEYLEGSDLAFEMDQTGRLPIGQACSVAVQLLDAISRAHEAGIVHRDLKPENIFLVRQADGTRRVKVVDFGISKLDDTKGALRLTGTSDMMGTPLYMAPEQMATPELVDGRADIWSIGCVLYEMLSGKPPFEARSVLEICNLVMNQDPRPLCDAAPDIPRELGETVMRCLKRDLDARISSAEELSSLLLPFAAGSSIPSRSFVSGVSGMPISGIPISKMNTNTTGVRGLTQTLSDVDPFRPRRRFLPWVAGALLLLVGIGGAAAWGVLPIQWGATFAGAVEGAPEVPSVGAAQVPEKGPAALVDEIEAKVDVDVDVETLEEEGDAPNVPREAAPREGAPASAGKPPAPSQSTPSESRNLPPRPVAAPRRPTTAAPTSQPRRTTVAAPYEEFAEFGGRR